MKKILLLLLPLLSMISCGNSYTYNGFTVKSYDVHVSANDWQYTDLSSNNYFYCVVDMPEKDIDEVAGHGDDIVFQKLHMEQDLVDVHLVEFTFGHDKQSHGQAEQKKRQKGKKNAKKKGTCVSHKDRSSRER